LNQAKVEEDNKQEDGEVRLEECAQHRAYFHIESSNSDSFEESSGSLSSSGEYDSIEIETSDLSGNNKDKFHSDIAD